MKTFYLKLIIFLFSCTIGFCQELNNKALSIKKTNPDTYKEISTFAKNKWINDHEMIVYTINNQSKALIEIVGIMDLPTISMFS